jgi:signal transduction histidine kinase
VSETPPNWFERLRHTIRQSLAARLLAIATVSVIGLVGVGWVAYGQFSQQLMRILIDPEIASVTNDLIVKAGPGLNGQISLQDVPYDTRYVQMPSGRYYEIARIRDDSTLEAQVLSPSLFDVTINLTPVQVAEATGPDAAAAPHFMDVPNGPDGEAVRIATRVAQFQNLDGRYLFIVAAAPRGTLAPAANLVFAAFAAFVAFCTFMLAAATVLQIRVGLQPLSNLRIEIANVRRGQRERLTDEYPAELQPVATELNALVDHNREVVERARRHVGNLAHALKTPIAVLKNAAADHKMDDDVLQQSIMEMEGFVERQLRRARVAARAEAGAGAHALTIGYRTPVKRNLEDLVFMMEQKYDHVKALDISLDAVADATFRGEREDLLEMAANLVDNACKYGKHQVIVQLVPPKDGTLEIVVEDDGAGMSEEQIATVTAARGTRLDEATPGQGLGLSILKETVELYAGKLEFGRSDLGGLKARLRLPATD